jgi:crotonobetainyl-CoA:carnitine CoA-transferase CaiB-like acyl-CoA transferase
VSQILTGIRVLDFGRYIAGPLCAAMLADLGAEVIRVERPGGGDDRYLMPAFDGREGAMYLQANRGKKAITLDFGKPAGKELARRLIATSDIVIANFTSSALEHFGLDYPTLCSIRSDIILTSIGAFDSRSDQRDVAGFDGVGQAISGGIYLTGEPGKPYRSATSYVDFSTALAAAFGTLTAVIQRLTTGKGAHVEANLAAMALNIMNPALIEQFTGSNAREPIGNRSPIAGPSDIFAACDGWFIMQVIGQQMFRRWTELVERPDLFRDSRFSSDILRGRHGTELSDIMRKWVKGRSRDECLARLTEANIAASPLLTPADIVGGTMGLRETYFHMVEFPDTNGVPLARPPVRLAANADLPPQRPPLVGEHNAAVYGELGLATAELDELSAIGII